MSRWHRPARLALLVLVVLSFAWGGVRLVDPVRKAPERPTVDADAPLARIAYDAMRGTETGNYAYAAVWGNETDRREVLSLRVDNADRQVRGTLSFDASPPDREVYGSEAGTWRRTLGEGSSPWRFHEPASPYVFHDERAVLRAGANVSVVASNASTLVVRVNDTDTAAAVVWGIPDWTGDEPNARATLTLAVDREAGVLRWSRFRWSRPDGDDEGREVGVVVQRFDRWGEVDVRRPAGLPYSFDAVANDLLNECPECEEAEE